MARGAGNLGMRGDLMRDGLRFHDRMADLAAKLSGFGVFLGAVTGDDRDP